MDSALMAVPGVPLFERKRWQVIWGEEHLIKTQEKVYGYVPHEVSHNSSTFEESTLWNRTKELHDL